MTKQNEIFEQNAEILRLLSSRNEAPQNVFNQCQTVREVRNLEDKLQRNANNERESLVRNKE